MKSIAIDRKSIALDIKSMENTKSKRNQEVARKSKAFDKKSIAVDTKSNEVTEIPQDIIMKST